MGSHRHNVFRCFVFSLTTLEVLVCSHSSVEPVVMLTPPFDINSHKVQILDRHIDFDVHEAEISSPQFSQSCGAAALFQASVCSWYDERTTSCKHHLDLHTHFQSSAEHPCSCLDPSWLLTQTRAHRHFRVLVLTCLVSTMERPDSPFRVDCQMLLLPLLASPIHRSTRILLRALSTSLKLKPFE